MSDMDSDHKVMAEVIRRAITDSKWRMQLLKSPKTMIEGIRGRKLAPELVVHIHEETANERHVVIPYTGHIKIDVLGPAEIEKITSIGIRSACSVLRTSAPISRK